MRIVHKINDKWRFIKENAGINEVFRKTGEEVTIPHTWNAIDGQDGGNDYYRGTCWYVKSLPMPEMDTGDVAYLEFRGVNSSADVYVNGKHLAHHDGGYSTFRVNITDVLQEDNQIAVSVDNAPNRKVYPQKADFTFYGGIYRDVYLIVAKDAHFDLDYYGSPGVQVTPEIKGKDACVKLKAYVTGTGDLVRFHINGTDSTTCVIQNGVAEGMIPIENVRLWNGRKDPWLYQATAELIREEKVIDAVSVKFGCRTFDFDQDKGFILNGNPYPLRGVSRHQDRRGVGNALTPEMHKEDMELIAELGANTIRLAHYQHDQYFYDLCDAYGMAVWAEIPYISEHMPEAKENTLSQMRELVSQNYNHPSIICWGLSNEITCMGESEDIVEHHKVLNDLVHEMDQTRPSVTANVFMLGIDSDMLCIPDILSYNLYYGWYLGTPEDNDIWFDEFRTKYPDKVIGLSEYGADATIQFQTGTPEKGDYTEEYQAVYHEHILEMLMERPYIWASHVWNMFDFGADGRDEGGENGVNHKGLVTFDRKIKKDAFYLYKAYLSEDPFIHLCGRRYEERVEETTCIKVYTNQNEVALYCDGELAAVQKGKKVFTFCLPINGTHNIEARSGDLTDHIKVIKVAEANKDYILDKGEIINWFEKEGMEFPEGYFSIKDTVGEITRDPEGAVIIAQLKEKIVATRGDVAKGVKMNEAMKKMMDAVTVEVTIRQGGEAITEEMVLSLNKALNKIRKPI